MMPPSRILTVFFPALALLAPFASPSPAQEARVPETAREALSLTIYGDDLAVVRDRRSAALPPGTTMVVVEGMSPRLLPDSVLVTLPGEAPPRVLWQRYEDAGPTRDALLARFVGQEVLLVVTNEDGDDTVKTARLLSVDPGVVLSVDGRIEVDPAGRIAFPRLPEDLRGEPRLTVAVAGDSAASGPLEVVYLTGGLSWYGDYVALLDAEAGRLDLTGFATIRNETGMDLPGATLRLAAGVMNRAAPPPVQPMAEARAMLGAPAADDNAPVEEPLMGMRFYDLPGTASLARNEERRIALLEARGVPAGISYSYRPDFLGFRPVPDVQEAHPRRSLVFANTDKAGLGRALPAGIVRVYARQDNGGLRLVGEERLQDASPGGEIRLELGRDLDLPIRRKQAEFTQISPRVIESAYQVVIRNSKDEDVVVQVEESFFGDWRVVAENMAHAREDAFTARWSVPVPAGGEATLNYRVRVNR